MYYRSKTLEIRFWSFSHNISFCLTVFTLIFDVTLDDFLLGVI